MHWGNGWGIASKRLGHCDCGIQGEGHSGHIPCLHYTCARMAYMCVGGALKATAVGDGYV